MIPVITIPFMSFQLLGMESKTVKNTGLSEILGELIGARADSLEYAEEQTISILKVTATGLPQSTRGLTYRSIKLLMKTETIPIMTLLSIHSLNQNGMVTIMQFLATISLEQRMAVVVSKRMFSQMVKSSLRHVPGRSPLTKIFHHLLIGETWMALIISPGTRISTYLNTVVHAGRKAQLLPLLIDSIS